MNTINNFSRVLGALLLCAGLVMTSCTEDEPEQLLVRSVSLDKTSAEISIGETLELTATVLPDNAENLEVTWTSSDASVATVENGLVTAIKAGKAEITVKTVEGGKTAVCKVTVKAEPVVFALDKVTAATASFSGHLNVPAADLPYCQVTVYYSDAETFNMNDAKSLSATSFDQNQDFTIVLTNLKYGVKYHYCMVADVKQADKVYGEVNEFTTSDVTINIAYVSSTTSSASFSGTVVGLAQEDYDYIKVGLHYSDYQEIFEQGRGIKVEAIDIPEDGALSFELKELKLDTKYYYNTYISAASTVYGDAQEFKVGESLSFDVTVDESSITACTAKINGKISGISKEEIDGMEWGIQYSSSPTEFYSSDTILADEISEDGSFQIPILNLRWGPTYYYRSYAKQSSPYKVTYGEIKEFTRASITIVDTYIDNTSSSLTSAKVYVKATGISEVDLDYIDLRLGYHSIEQVVLNLTESYNPISTGLRCDWVNKVLPEKVDLNEGLFIFKLNELEYGDGGNGEDRYRYEPLKYGTAYYYRPVISCYPELRGDVNSFVLGEWTDISLSVKDISTSSAKITGKIVGYSSDEDEQLSIQYSPLEDFSSYSKISINDLITSDGNFSVSLTDLSTCNKYYVKLMIGKTSYREVIEFTTADPYASSTTDLDIASATDLSVKGSANCYIVSDKGLYKFKTVKGNSSEYLNAVASCKILWESYGTSVSIQPYDLIKGVCYRDEYIAFQTADSFKEGNAVIAATDAAGNILWSWHIWMTDQPQGQVYYNDAGTMMDRNLGATTSVPGLVGALGLLYQHDRKDPFLGSSSISESVKAKSTIIWPSMVEAVSGIYRDYDISHPTTYIKDRITAGRVWTTSDNPKSICDPCPAGWRVPDGGENGVWAKAYGSSDKFKCTYDSTNNGINFSGKFGSDQTIWYPASGDICNDNLSGVGSSGGYWSAGRYSYELSFGSGGSVLPSNLHYVPEFAQSVRCLQE